MRPLQLSTSPSTLFLLRPTRSLPSTGPRPRPRPRRQHDHDHDYGRRHLSTTLVLRQSQSQSQIQNQNDQPSPSSNFYRTHGRALFKALTLAFFSYQVVYWAWLTLETEELRDQKNREIKALEAEVRLLDESRTAQRPD